jgi:hypothetical protein
MIGIQDFFVTMIAAAAALTILRRVSGFARPSKNAAPECASCARRRDCGPANEKTASARPEADDHSGQASTKSAGSSH